MELALLVLFGSLLSMLFRFMPGLAVSFEALPKMKKQMIMGASLFVVSAGVFGLNCFGNFSLPVDLVMSCDKPSAMELLRIYIVMLVGNQATYPLIEK